MGLLLQSLNTAGGRDTGISRVHMVYHLPVICCNAGAPLYGMNAGDCCIKSQLLCCRDITWQGLGHHVPPCIHHVILCSLVDDDMMDAGSNSLIFYSDSSKNSRKREYNPTEGIAGWCGSAVGPLQTWRAGRSAAAGVAVEAAGSCAPSAPPPTPSHSHTAERPSESCEHQGTGEWLLKT